MCLIVYVDQWSFGFYVIISPPFCQKSETNRRNVLSVQTIWLFHIDKTGPKCNGSVILSHSVGWGKIKPHSVRWTYNGVSSSISIWCIINGISPFDGTSLSVTFCMSSYGCISSSECPTDVSNHLQRTLHRLPHGAIFHLHWPHLQWYLFEIYQDLWLKLECFVHWHWWVSWHNVAVCVCVCLCKQLPKMATTNVEFDKINHPTHFWSSMPNSVCTMISQGN